MLEYLDGIVVERGNDYVVVDKGGIGFKILTPSRIDDGRVRLYLVLFIKEEQPVLYGFKTREERDIFQQLLGVSGVGVKHAFSILRGFTPGEFLEILEEGDHTRLTDIPGIGIKTAQRIILELKGKLDFIQSEIFEDVVSALVNLGFDKKEVVPVVRGIIRETRDINEAIKKALQKLTEKG